MNRATWVFVVAVLSTSCSLAEPSADKVVPTFNLKFCDFDVPRELMQGNFSSLIIYEFRVTGDGRPEAVSRLLDEFVGPEKVKACLSDWRLRGLDTSAVYKVVFSWRHGKGWVKVSIVGPDIDLVVEQSDNPAPYLTDLAGASIDDVKG